MKTMTQTILDAFEMTTASITFAERMRVLEDSISLYRERGHEAVALALAERLVGTKEST